MSGNHASHCLGCFCMYSNTHGLFLPVVLKMIVIARCLFSLSKQLKHKKDKKQTTLSLKVVLKGTFYSKNIYFLNLCFRFCILWMLDRRAKQAVHCCIMYWQHNYKINPECRFLIIDDSVIERAQLDFQILLHRSKWLYRLWSSGESAAISFCISCCIYVLV